MKNEIIQHFLSRGCNTDHIAFVGILCKWNVYRFDQMLQEDPEGIESRIRDYDDTLLNEVRSLQGVKAL